MARQIIIPRPPTVYEYHVYDALLNNLGGQPIIQKDVDVRVVLLTRDQASYFIDQGVIGETPFVDLDTDSRELLSQFSGGRIAVDVEP